MLSTIWNLIYFFVKRYINLIGHSVVEFPDCLVLELLWLLPSKIFPVGKCAQFRVLQAEHGSEACASLSDHDGLSVYIWSSAGWMLRSSSNTKKVRFLLDLHKNCGIVCKYFMSSLLLLCTSSELENKLLLIWQSHHSGGSTWRKAAVFSWTSACVCSPSHAAICTSGW